MTELKKMFDEALEAAFKKVELEKLINEKVERVVTDTLVSAIGDYDIRRAVERKMKEAINIDNLDFGNYGKFVENVFTKAVKDFNLESLDRKLTDIAKTILGNPDKEIYDLWEDIILPIMFEIDEEKWEGYSLNEALDSGWEFSGYAKYTADDTYGSKFTHIYIDDSEYLSSKYRAKIQFDLMSNDDGTYHIYSASYGNFKISSDSITITSPYKDSEKALANIVLKNCKVKNVEESLDNMERIYD